MVTATAARRCCDRVYRVVTATGARRCCDFYGGCRGSAAPTSARTCAAGDQAFGANLGPPSSLWLRFCADAHGRGGIDASAAFEARKQHRAPW